MQNRISKAAVTWRLLLSLLIVSVVIACEDTNNVGSGVVEPSQIRVDTIFVDNFEKMSSSVFSGGITNPPLGSYNDPILGDYMSTTLIKPSLISATSVPSKDSTDMQLLLSFEDRPVFGEESASTDFSIFRVTERWRATTLSSDDNIMYDETELIGSFTYNNEDSIYIDISDSLFFDYVDYASNTSNSRDSLYNYEFFGISIVPETGTQPARIIYPDISKSKFLFIEEVENANDTLTTLFDTQGFTIERQNIPTFNDRLYLNSLFDGYYKINLKSIADLIPEGLNILKADLIVYEDTRQLENSLTNNETRPALNLLDFKFADESELLYELQFTSSDFLAARDTVDNSFAFNLTNLINSYKFGSPSDDFLYLNVNPGGGVIRSTLLYDSTSVPKVRPKLVLKIAE